MVAHVFPLHVFADAQVVHVHIYKTPQVKSNSSIKKKLEK